LSINNTYPFQHFHLHCTEILYFCAVEMEMLEWDYRNKPNRNGVGWKKYGDGGNWDV